MFRNPYDLLSPTQRATVDESISANLEASRDAALYLLQHGLMGTAGKRRLASRILLAAVLESAGQLGLVDCSKCGDVGCAYCLWMATLPGAPTPRWSVVLTDGPNGPEATATIVDETPLLCDPPAWTRLKGGLYA